MASDAPKGAQAPPSGPPYLPQTAQSGGLPTPIPDDPIIAVLLLFFVGGAVTNMTIFQLNRRRDHKFIPSALLFGFCMARIVALSMRMAWASHPTNINVAIAANIFTAAGVLLLFVINIVFTQRIVRAYHPTFGWHRATHWTFLALYFSIIASLIMVITSTVHSFFTLDLDARQKDRDVQLFAGTYLAVMAFLPIPVVILAILFPRQNAIEKFGRGPFRHKLMLLLFTATLLSFGAGFRIGVNFAPRPASDPAWYHHKAAFYTVNFVIELIVVYTYAISRFDQRFHIPNGSSAPGHYSGAVRKNSDDQHLDSAAVTDIEGAMEKDTEDK